MPDVVFGSHAGGLGDHLLYSTLPELYAREGHQVFLNPDDAHGGFRNPEVRELILMNPHISGLTDRPPTIGIAKFTEQYGIIKAAKIWDTSIQGIEAWHGFMPNLNSEGIPKIYYKPNFMWEWRNETVVDPTSISQGFSGAVFEEFLNWVRRWHTHQIDISDMTYLGSKHSGNHGTGVQPNNRRYVVRDIFEYIDIMYSCLTFISTESGPQSLAAAVRPKIGPDHHPTFACMTQMTYNDNLFVWPNVKYYITGQLSPDFHQYP